MSRTPRVFVGQRLEGGSTLLLEGEAAAHLGRVLRARAGQAVVLFDGDGSEHEGEILDAGRRRVRIAVGAARLASRESPLSLVLLQGICRAERMDWVMRKATELGVSAIRPALTERCVVRLDAKREAARIEHWRAIMISACEQCGRNRLPALLPPLPLAEALAAHTDATGVLLDPLAEGGPERLTATGRPVALLVGPEGGLTPAEQAAARTAGFLGVRLGPRVLRTETAAVVGLALLQARFGDLG